MKKRRIAILGGGPGGMFMYKRLIESGIADLEVNIFEKKNELGSGMPYSREGANVEHITNVSDNEIPQIVTSIEEWVNTAPKEVLQKFDITPESFNEYKVLPRLFFGEYLSSQFDLLQEKAKELGIVTNVHFGANVIDIIDLEEKGVKVVLEGSDLPGFDEVIICTGHNWPKRLESKLKGYYDSPYPPSKLELKANHPVAIKGSSLTAIDAIRTLARNNGKFSKDEEGKISFERSDESPEFKLVMHSLNGLLPGIRFHLDDSHLSNESLLTPEEITEHRYQNDGFLSLDFVFDKNFKEIFRDKDPEFYERIRGMNLETFVDSMMELRERLDPFVLFRAEYAEAEKSIKRRESVYWKEMLAVLSFAMNYPAKYLSAEDMQRLKKVLMPLISIVIAFVPQTSCREMLALQDAGVLELVSVDRDSKVEPDQNGGITYHYKDDEGQEQSVKYKTFVNSIGQPQLAYDDFPFRSLIKDKKVSPARIKFRSTEEGKKQVEEGNKEVEQDDNGDYYLKVSGITINDNFQIIDHIGAYNSRIYIMAVPYIGGYNPDYSGLDFCEEASGRIIKSLVA